jgi:hypothetical protein
VAVTMVLLLILPIIVFHRHGRREAEEEGR